MKSIAVLLTVHDRRKKTLACLDDVYAQCLPQHVKINVFMVDDGCTDGTPEAVREQFPDTHIIHADGSLYWNRGMYKAWEVAAQTKTYDYYVWLNDDTQLFHHSIEKLLALSVEQSDKAIIVGATRASQEYKLTYGGRIGHKIAPCDGKPHEIEHFNGNIVLVPQAAYTVLGNLDYYYRHSKGDFDYGIRARKAGIKMYQCGEVLGICDAHEMIDAWCNPQVPFSKRWKLMHMPNGMPPKETFHLEKQINLVMAIVHYYTIYLRCMFPQLWKQKIANQ